MDWDNHKMDGNDHKMDGNDHCTQDQNNNELDATPVSKIQG